MKELDKIQDFISQLLKHLGYLEDEFEVGLNEKDDVIEVEVAVPESDSGIMIGRGGEVLISIQRILRLVFFNKIDKKIRVDVNSYKKKKQEKLKEFARKVASEVKETNKAQKINKNLSSYERFIIHSVISQEFPDLESESVEDGVRRVLTIKPKKIESEE